MAKQIPANAKDWQRYHYKVERDYAQRIIRTPKGSEKRRQLLAEAYDQIIGDIIQHYDPEGGETHYSEVVAAIVRTLTQGKGTILDIGCGSGNLISILAQEGYQVRGIDIAEDCIARARERLRWLSCADCVELVGALDYRAEETFTCIVMDNVVEHVVPDSLNDLLVKCYNALNVKGYIVILTPHRFSGPHDVSKHFLPLGAKAEGFHFREFSFTDLESELSDAGFQEVLGFPFHPRLLWRLRLVPRPSLWAARKARYLEKRFETPLGSKAMTINRTLTRAVLAILFPSVCIGKKCLEETER